jgi:hypothetical protein
MTLHVEILRLTTFEDTEFLYVKSELEIGPPKPCLAWPGAATAAGTISPSGAPVDLPQSYFIK